MSCQHHGPAVAGATYPELNYTAGEKWIKHLAKDRLGNFNGGHFSDINLSSVLFTHRVDNSEHVKLQVWSAPGLTKPLFAEAMKHEFKDAKKGDSFGPSWTNHWWKVTLTIPGYWQQYERVQFEFDPGCEAMIFTTDGTPLQGITGGYGGDRRVEFIIPLEARKQGTYEIVIESSCNGMFGVPWNGDTIAPPDMNRFFSLASADLVVPNQEAWHLLWDFTTLRELVDTLPGNTALQNKALVAANEIMNVFNRGDPAGVTRGRKIAEEVFGEGWQEKGEKVYDTGARSQIWGIGHCHIDTAWLWPYHVTQQKVARSWATQVDLMERYPEHRFTCSSAQQYKWLEQQYPALFERVKTQVLAGKFHPIGGAWVEHDANMPSGEALVRQHLFGQRFFQSRFGIRSKTGWLPDSFGLSGAVPQLLRGAGMDSFFTQKMSWNNINTFPHNSMNWVGIDGSQVLCHMTPVDTYTAQASFGDVNKGLTNHKNLESTDTALLVFGNGDGGGGPLPKMLENLRRIRATANHHREVPSVSMGRSVDEFFEDLAKHTNQGQKLPNWNGEMYLEFHRGTYTSHGSIKKGNRHSEILLRDVEHIATLASLYKLYKTTYVYPKAKIDDSWEKVLLNQFHDVLPGSAIGMVYDDAEKLYAEVRHDGKALLEEAFSVLLPQSSELTSETQVRGLATSGEIAAYNTTFFARQDVIEIPLVNASSRFRSKVHQTSKDGRVGYVLMGCEGARLGSAVGALQSGSVSVQTQGEDVFVMRNDNMQLTISDGRISSLLDLKLGRELIFGGLTGGLVMFEDQPNYWDAWDVEIHHLETAEPLKFSKITVVNDGPLRASVKAQLKYGKSTVVVTISLDAITATPVSTSRSLFRFDAVVDWHERHKFLKFELPLDIKNDMATYETQFGHVQRPTHKNTTWDIAKFEVCGHKYADLSEFGYGVALLSESKYGFSCRGNVLRMSLLRSATAPDAEQDQGEHKFSWAVLPHEGHFIQSDVPIAAYLFNSPLHVRYLSAGPENLLSSFASPFTIENASNVFLETAKRGEDDSFGSQDFNGEKTVILRLYEAYGGHAVAQLKIGSHLPVRKVVLTNMLEDEEEELHILRSDGDSPDSLIRLKFRAFEVKTVKLVIGGGKEATNRDSWIAITKSKLLY